MPTSTNLSLVTPASTDFVMNGATNMTTLANGIDAYFGAWTSYTPTPGNISTFTSGAAYKKIGKIGFVRINITSGTANGAFPVTVTLPAGWTPAANGGAVAYSPTLGLLTAAIGTGGVVTIYKGTGIGNWTGGDNCACRMQFVIELT